MVPNHLRFQLRYTEMTGSPTWSRTTDTLINSQALYPLSYRGNDWRLVHDSNVRPPAS